MAKTPATVIAEINQYIIANGVGAISGPVLNGVLQDLCDLVPPTPLASGLMGYDASGNPLAVSGGSGGTPGGSSGQLQYNNAGVFGGYGVGSGLSVVGGDLTATGGGGGNVVTSIPAMQALTGTVGAITYLNLVGHSGNFAWSAANLSTFVSADVNKGITVAPASDTTGASGAWVRQYDGPWRPSWFGVLYDGVIIEPADGTYGNPTIISGTDNGAALTAMCRLARYFSILNLYVYIKDLIPAGGTNVVLWSFATWNISVGFVNIKKLKWDHNHVKYQINTINDSNDFSWPLQTNPERGATNVTLTSRIATTNLIVYTVNAALNYNSTSGIITVSLQNGQQQLGPGSIFTLSGMGGTGAFANANVTNALALVGTIPLGSGSISTASYNSGSGVVTLGLANPVNFQIGSIISISGLTASVGSVAPANIPNAIVTGISTPTTDAVLSATYTQATGLVTLTLTSAHGLSVGAMFSVSSLAGTGTSYNANIGNAIAVAGTTGSTLVYAIDAGQTMAFTSATGTAAWNATISYTIAPSLTLTLNNGVGTVTWNALLAYNATGGSGQTMTLAGAVPVQQGNATSVILLDNNFASNIIPGEWYKISAGDASFVGFPSTLCYYEYNTVVAITTPSGGPIIPGGAIGSVIQMNQGLNNEYRADFPDDFYSVFNPPAGKARITRMNSTGWTVDGVANTTVFWDIDHEYWNFNLGAHNNGPAGGPNNAMVMAGLSIKTFNYRGMGHDETTSGQVTTIISLTLRTPKQTSRSIYSSSMGASSSPIGTLRHL
jgi:hypothetical protein